MNNCPNCGAPFDLEEDKCKYCGTPYYDLSCIPFQKPFIMRLNVGTDENPKIIMFKAYLEQVTHRFEHDYLGFNNIFELVFVPLGNIKIKELEMRTNINEN